MRVLPVVHVASRAQALTQAHVAFKGGADGAFLIQHNADDQLLRAATADVLDAYPDRFIGINVLGLPLPAAIAVAATWHATAVWADDAGIDERLPPHDQPAGLKIEAATAKAIYLGEVFGGVAFKYQRTVPLDALPAAAAAASPWMQVVTTSGPGTGQPIELDRLRAMRSGLAPSTRLGLASGVTPSNVRSLIGLVDDVLVATGISSDFHTIDPRLLEQLLNEIRSHS